MIIGNLVSLDLRLISEDARTDSRTNVDEYARIGIVDGGLAGNSGVYSQFNWKGENRRNL